MSIHFEHGQLTISVPGRVESMSPEPEPEPAASSARASGLEAGAGSAQLAEFIEGAIGLSSIAIMEELRHLAGGDLELTRDAVRRVLGRHLLDHDQLDAALSVLFGDYDHHLDDGSRPLRQGLIGFILTVFAGLVAESFRPSDGDPDPDDRSDDVQAVPAARRSTDSEAATLG
ncbi:hypothetical protein [Haliangium sp.]|uniref:hypothetical protein n=1 Tax=Haliangium sp. TaxID=2663208 RepID=UPI003D0A8088